MPTFERRRFVRRSIDAFLAQEFTDSELLILDDGEDAVEDLVPKHSRIRYLRHPHRMTVGAKRNLLCARADGELIVHWDDDDWYPPERVRLQVEALQRPGAAVSGTSMVYYYEPSCGRAWRYQYEDEPFVTGNTLAYWKAFWSAHPFVETQIGEDCWFVRAVQPGALIDLARASLCVGTIHAQNVSPKPRSPPSWIPVALTALRADVGDHFLGLEPPDAPWSIPRAPARLPEHGPPPAPRPPYQTAPSSSLRPLATMRLGDGSSALGAIGAPRPRRGIGSAANSPPMTRRTTMAEPAKVAVVVTCMKRKAFLERTAPLVLAQPHLRYCLVDYSCPDGSGDWLETTFPEAVARRRAWVERVTGRTRFHKCDALNIGAESAIRHGAEYLCFLDADTVVRPGFASWLARCLTPGRFLIAGLRDDGSDVSSLLGVLALSADEFRASGGFDMNIQDWGAEDVELRLRLHVRCGLDYQRIPLRYLASIDHDDALREENCRAPKALSHDRNFGYVFQKVREWAGHSLAELPPSARGLLWRGPGEVSVTAAQSLLARLLRRRLLPSKPPAPATLLRQFLDSATAGACDHQGHGGQR